MILQVIKKSFFVVLFVFYNVMQAVSFGISEFHISNAMNF